MLLSVPLTMAVKIGFEENPSTRWLAILLSGDEVTRLAPEAVEASSAVEPKNDG